jgi:signal transduction histidine kinase
VAIDDKNNDAQRALASHDALRTVQDTSTIWLWEQDADFRFVMDLRGRDHVASEGTVIGRRRWESPHSAPLHGTWDDHRRWVEARKPFRDFEFRVGRGARARYISTTGVPIHDADGRFVGYRGTAMDITELKNAQAETERAQSLLRLASRLGRVAAWSLELPERRAEFSPDFLRLLGFRPDDRPSAKDVLALVRRRQQAEVNIAWIALLDGIPFDLEVRMYPKAGQPMWVRLIGEAERHEDGSIKRIQGAAQDITASKEDRERLRTLGEQLATSNAELADRVRGRTRELELLNTELKGFAHALAHDLKAPIATVQGFGGALEEAIAASDFGRGAHYAARIKAAGARMEEYVDALLSLAQTSQVALYVTDVDLSAIAASVLDELQGQATTRRLVRTITPGLVARGDHRLLRMLLENLLGNAWKFTARLDPARISLTSSVDDGGETVYTVRDNGAGFDMAWAGKLFGSFQRLHAADEYQGTGIGLANAQRVVIRHGGRIWAASRVDEGATFHFTLGAPRPGS